MLSLQSVSKIYRTAEVETSALNDVSMQIAAGEFVAIMGPSGCGKSTLLSILGLLDVPSAGSYELFGDRTSGCSEHQLTLLRRRRIGFVFQDFNLIDTLTVQENVEVGLIYRGGKRSERRRLANEALERVGIAHRARHAPRQLSGGQQQRAALARAIAAAPQLLLADEPTGNLDTENGEQVMELLKDINRSGTTIVMVTHTREHARHAHRTVNLLDGRLAN